MHLGDLLRNTEGAVHLPVILKKTLDVKLGKIWVHTYTQGKIWAQLGIKKKSGVYLLFKEYRKIVHIYFRICNSALEFVNLAVHFKRNVPAIL